jgi:hypothetical protein
VPARLARYGAPLLVACAACASMSAQRAPIAPSPVLRTLDCTFTTSAAVTWDARQPQVRVRREPILQSRIDNIDAVRGSAEVMLGAL